jgi:putative FmdB family regulatory protein
VTEHFFGRRKGRGSEQGEPEKLESSEDIRLAKEREGLFDTRSRRKAREDNDELSLVERKVWLTIGAIAALFAMAVALLYPIATPIAAGGVLAALRAAWKRRVDQEADGAEERGAYPGHREGGAAPDLLCEPMPVYEFECEECGCRFEELAPSDTPSLACPECGSERTLRLMSQVSPAGRQPRGAAVRSDESRRGEREAARGERIAESKRKRAAGESVRPRRGGDGT